MKKDGIRFLHYFLRGFGILGAFMSIIVTGVLLVVYCPWVFVMIVLVLICIFLGLVFE